MDDTKKIEIEKQAERYYIQFWFCVNRDLLMKSCRELYDELFVEYLQIYKEGRIQEQDLQAINKAFEKNHLGNYFSPPFTPKAH